MEFVHYSVMADEVTNGLNIKEDGVYVDCTLGGCGHTKRILSRLGKSGSVIGIDLDGDAIANARAAVKDERLKLWKGNYKDIREAVRECGFGYVNGVLFDLGVSSYQIDNAERGFSYIKDAPLDMRMDQSGGITAADIINTYPAEKLERIFREYGEERFSRKIIARVIDRRQIKPVETTAELAKLITEACPGYYRKEGHPAKRCFQALRIEVNGELEGLGTALKEAIELLVPGGRIAVIAFHSLEDRIVKTTFHSLESPCTCPKDFPVCVCGKKPAIKIITKKALVSSDEENEKNSRSHSAKLRIAEKL
ncbi:MAG: 16S rRNA (cytosine(1402)-N(4))-methyltransferase RsmH [Eubacteriales bacterium]|nr:16S rRNA (cytosine(1402)-N(4))-methyltransferase RsmH [Eubacteriales bacterium]